MIFRQKKYQKIWLKRQQCDILQKCLQKVINQQSMQKQGITNKYWQKDNFFKPKQLKPKSTISQSVKGICTNLWYKLGGESILTKKSSTHFDQLIMLGKKYTSYQLAQHDFHSLFWFTYRKELKINGEIRSDLGWGCLIRVGQMLLANCLKRYFQQSRAGTNEENIVVAFLDDSEGIRGNYSFQRILQKGKEKFQLKAGDWYNISQICYVLMSMQNYAPMKGSQSLKMIYFNQTLIFLDEVFQKVGLQICQCQEKKICCKLCNGQVNYRKKSMQKSSNMSGSLELDFEVLNLEDHLEMDLNSSWQRQEERNSRSSRKSQEESRNSRQGQSLQDKQKQIKFDLLLVVSTRISQNCIDQKNFEGILQLMSLPTSMGMIGGVPNKGLYFAGSCDQNLIYLDPHLVQPPVNTFNLSKQLNSFHCEDLRLIGRQKIDPSIAFAFYIRNLNQLAELIEKIDKMKSRNPQAVPISYMWQNQFRDQSEPIKSNQFQIDEYSPDFSFIA